MKRCIGLPGETLKITDGKIYVDGKQLPEPKNVQYFYYVHTNGAAIDDALYDKLGISVEDRHGEAPDYVLPLTEAMRKQLDALPWVLQVQKMPADPSENDYIFPMGSGFGWTHNDMGPFLIPKRGTTIEL